MTQDSLVCAIHEICGVVEVLSSVLFETEETKKHGARGRCTLVIEGNAFERLRGCARGGMQA